MSGFLAGLALGLFLGLGAAFLWLLLSDVSPLKKYRAYLPPRQAEALRAEIESLQEQLAALRQAYYWSTAHPANLILAADEKEMILYASPAISALSGFSPDQLEGMHLAELFTPESGQTLAAAIDQLRSSSADATAWRVLEQPLELLRQGGDKVWVQLQVKIDLTSAQSPRLLLCLADITQARLQEAEWEAQRQALRQQIADLAQQSEQHELFNRSFSTLLPCLDLEHPEQALEASLEVLCTALGCAAAMVCRLDELALEIAAVARAPREWLGRRLPLEERNPLAAAIAESRWVPLGLLAAPLHPELEALGRFAHGLAAPLGAPNDRLGVLALFEDTPEGLTPSVLLQADLYRYVIEFILKYSRLANRLHQLRSKDETTGLFNRHTLLELGGREIERARRYHRALSLILFDLHPFSELNARYGAAVGDQILQGVGRRLRSELRQADLAARLGGDEFAILLPETPMVQHSLLPKPTTVAAAIAVAERIRRLIAEPPFDTPAGALSLSVRCGVAENDPACPDFPTLLRRAETALAIARLPGQDAIQIWHSHMEPS